MLQNRNYVRFPYCGSVISFVGVLVMISPMEAVGVPKECIEVATYGQKLCMTGSTVIEIKQLVNFINCVKELYKIYMYKTTADWKVPKEVLAVIRKVPNLGKNSLAVAKLEGLCFVSVYLLYRTVDLYDRALNLGIDFQMYRKEFESLQIELQQVIHLIHEELLPNWRHLSLGVLRKITLDVDETLSRYHAKLMQVLQHIDTDIKKGRLGIAWAFAFQLGSAALCGVSALVGNVPGAISAFVASFTGLAGVRSFALTVQQLESLQNDVEGTLIEIEECRFLLQQKLLYSEIFVFLFNALFLVSVIALFKLNLPQPLSMDAQGGNN